MDRIFSICGDPNYLAPKKIPVLFESIFLVACPIMIGMQCPVIDLSCVIKFVQSLTECIFFFCIK